LTPQPRQLRIASDALERRRALDPNSSFIVQAPAGSGKTELLVQRFLRLLTRVAQPESILAITFTRKAAAEMRARVLQAMERSARGETGRDDNDRFTLDLAAAAIEHDGFRRWELLSHPARLRIQTIDALCAAIVRCMPWLGGLGSESTVVEDARELYTEAVEQTLRLLGTEEPTAQAIERLLLHLDNDWNKIRRMLEELLPRRDQWLRHIGAGQARNVLRAHIESTVSRLIQSALGRIGRTVPKGVEQPLVTLANFARRNGGLPEWETASEFPGAQVSDLAQWRSLAQLLLTGEGDWRKQVNVRQGFPANAKWEKTALQQLLAGFVSEPMWLQSLRQVSQLPDPAFTASQWAVLDSLLALLPCLAAELKVVFRERAQVDFTEINEAARRALGSPEQPSDLALALGERYEHVLIDEFQDTSVSQLELLDRLIKGWDSGGARTLFLVGDPMQSIYRFREAEVGLFLSICERGLNPVELQPLTLTSNFRSRQAIVDWVNRAFPAIFPESADSSVGAVPYIASVSEPRLTDLGHDHKGGVQIHPLFQMNRAQEALLVADLIQESGGGRTAVLVRARTHLPAIIAELKKRQIRFRAVDIDTLAESPAVSDLFALTRALLYPGDRTAWLAILRAPWCGLTLAELLDVAGPDRFAPLWNLIARSPNPRLYRFRGALARGLGSVRRVPLRECVEQTWKHLGGPQTLPDPASIADANTYLKLLEELEQGGDLPDLTVLARRVEQLFAQPDLSAPDESTNASLQIMTIHKAKGLEFDTVILPGLGYGADTDDTPLLRWAELDPASGGGLVIAPVPSAREPESPTFAYLEELEKQKDDQETRRLLYVAATRARERLHLIGHVEVADGKLRSPRRGSLLHLLWPAVSDDFEQAFAAHPQVASAPEERILPQTIRRVHLDISHKPGAEMGSGAADTSVCATLVAEETTSPVGTVVRFLLNRPSGLLVEVLLPVARACLGQLGVAPDQLDASVHLVIQALQATLADERGQWILRQRPGDAFEFCATLHEAGFDHHLVIDRTFVEEGTRWIIDYNAGSYEGGDLETFLANEVERRRPQLERYVNLLDALEPTPVRVGLYFPLLACWREVEPKTSAFVPGSS